MDRNQKIQAMVGTNREGDGGKVQLLQTYFHFGDNGHKGCRFTHVIDEAQEILGLKYNFLRS